MVSGVGSMSSETYSYLHYREWCLAQQHWNSLKKKVKWETEVSNVVLV